MSALILCAAYIAIGVAVSIVVVRTNPDKFFTSEAGRWGERKVTAGELRWKSDWHDEYPGRFFALLIALLWPLALPLWVLLSIQDATARSVAKKTRIRDELDAELAAAKK